MLGHSSREEALVMPSQAFAEYREYLVKGPSDQNDADTWFLFTVGENGMPEEDRAGYLNELSNRFNTFIGAVKDSPAIKPDHSFLLEVSESYQQILTLIVDGKNLNELSAQLLKSNESGEDERELAFLFGTRDADIASGSRSD